MRSNSVQTPVDMKHARNHNDRRAQLDVQRPNNAPTIRMTNTNARILHTMMHRTPTQKEH